MNVLDRLRAAGISDHVARRHLRYHRVHVNGVPTTDPATPADKPATIVLRIGRDLPIDEESPPDA